MSETENPNPDEGTGEVTPPDSGTILGGDEEVDISTLFTPEEVEAKKTAIQESKAEEDRRAKLTDEEKAAEDARKTNQEQWNAPPPEKYEWVVPDGMALDTELADDLSPLFKELELSQAKAQKVVDAYIGKVIPRITQQQTEMWENTKAEWGKTALADKVFGGDKHEAYMVDAGRVMDAFQKDHPDHGTALRKAMAEYGYGNEPSLVAFVKWAGKKIGEDTKIPPQSGEQGKEEKPRQFKYENTK